MTEVSVKPQVLVMAELGPLFLFASSLQCTYYCSAEARNLVYKNLAFL